MIGIIDYGMGNLRSVQKSLEFIGYSAEIVTKQTEIKKCDKIILPGVGAFADAIHTIKKMEFDKAIAEFINTEKAFLGICLGMQLLFDVSYENGEYEGLGILSGEIKKLSGDVKIPHMGWNSLDIKKTSVFNALPNEPYVYFVHSYYLETKADIVSATTFYGKDINVAVQHKNISALQFHPEKSGDIGLSILKNFAGQ